MIHFSHYWDNDFLVQLLVFVGVSKYIIFVQNNVRCLGLLILARI